MDVDDTVIRTIAKDLKLRNQRMTSEFLHTMTNSEWVDSHCHFDFSEFEMDRSAVLSRCVEAGLHRMLVPGVVSAQWPALQKLAEIFTPFFFAVGVHPWWISSSLHSVAAQHFGAETIDLNAIEMAIERYSHHPKCVAIGECGLDGAIAAPMSLQIDWLAVQLNIAQRKNLPVIIHARRAHNELVEQLKQVSLIRSGVIHAFSGSLQMAEDFIQLGFKLGIGGTITYERAQKTRSAVKSLPLESLLLETDAPDMPLFGFQGRRNSPEKVLLVAQELAKLRGEPLEIILEQTTKNAKQLFGF